MAKHKNSCKQEIDDTSLFLLLRWTGLRVSDAVNLRWSSVHFGRGVNGEIEVLTQKRGKIAIVPLSTELRDDLEAIYNQRNPHAEDRVLFNAETGSPFISHVYLSRPARDFCHRAGVKGVVAQMLADTVETVYTITQVSPTYRLGMPVQIEFADGSAQVQTTKVEQERTDVTVPITQPVYGLTLDPHFELLHATTEEWSAGEELRYYTRGALLWDSTKTPEALATFKEGLGHIPKVDSQGVAFLLHLEIGWIHQEAEKWGGAQAEYDLALAQAVRPPNRLPRLYLNIAQVAQKRGDPDCTMWATRNAISADKAPGPRQRYIATSARAP